MVVRYTVILIILKKFNIELLFAADRKKTCIMQHCYMILTDEITLADLRTLGMCLSLIGSKISEDMVVQFEDSLLMKESPEEAVRPIVEDLFFNTR